MNEHKLCQTCGDDGLHGGCPKCGLYPYPKPKTIDGVQYYYVTNQGKDEETYLSYKKLQDNNLVKVRFEQAFDRYRNPIPDDQNWVAIWLAVEDKKIAKQHGLYT